MSFKPTFFFVSKKQWHGHHLDKDRWEGWTVDLPQSLHSVISALQRLDPTDENATILETFRLALSQVIIDMRRELDTNQKGEGENVVGDENI